MVAILNKRVTFTSETITKRKNIMKNLEKYEKAFNYFKQSYKYKMGGTQTIILPNKKSKFFDDMEFYSGRGSKHNATVRHHEIGEIKVTRKKYSEFLTMLNT